MDNVITQRKADISNIANIMSDINDIAKDLAIETQNQGKKLAKIDEDITVADDNAKDALGELKEAEMHQKKSGRCMYFLVSIIMLCLIILGVILATSG